MKAINIKIATFSFAAMLLASCSDSNNILENGGTTPIKTVVGSAVTSTTDAQELASRITNYKVQNTTASARTRAYKGSDWNGSSIPEGAVELTSDNDVYNAIHNESNGSVFVIPAGVTITQKIDMAPWINSQGKNRPITLYIAGTLDNSNQDDAWGAGNIRILKSGTFKGFKNNSGNGEVFGKNNIVNYGKLEIPKNVTKLVLDGSNTLIDNHGSLDLTNTDVKLSNNAVLNVTGTLKAKTLSITNSEVYSGCSANISDFVYISNDSKLHVSYLHCKNFKQDSGGKVVVKDQSMIECDNVFMNLNSQQGTYALGETDAVCVIKAAKLAFNAPGPDAENKIRCNMFATRGERAGFIVDVPEDKIYGITDDNEKTLDALSDGNHGQAKRPKDSSITEEGHGVTLNNDCNVFLSSSNEASKYVIKKTESEDCKTPGFNDNKPQPDKPKTDLIISVDYDHTHNISATGIMDLDGYLYMSYHTNQEQKDNADNSHGGCVEVLTPVENNKIRLLQYLYDSQRVIDFNHLLAVELNNGEKKIFLPGNSKKKGALLSYMTINGDHLLATESKEITTADVDKDGKPIVKIVEPLQYAQLHPATEEYKNGKYDENCVVYNKEKDHLIVATTEGYVVYDANTMNEVDKIERPGKVKHVAIGDGKIVGLYLNDKNHSSDDEVGATIEVINRIDEDFENSTKFNTTVGIKPNDGKNVVSVRDNMIYVCQSGLGLYVYNMKGEEQWHWQMPKAWNAKKNVYKALCNGCDVDDKYVYLAYGSYGLVVLDKNTHEVVAHRVASKSANYVKVKDNYIYVAYGRDRLQVYNLSTGAQTETNYQKK